MTPPRYTLLIIDDTPEDRVLYTRILARDRRYHYAITEAATAEEGLEACRDQRPDLVLVDYLLPDETGLAVIERLIQEYGPEGVGILMLTGAGDEAVAVAAMKLGAHDYLVKSPQMGDQLTRAMHHILEKLALQRHIAHQRQSLETSYRQLQEAEHRIRFLAAASQALATSLDPATTLATLARLAGSFFGALCSIDLGSGRGAFDLAAMVYHDPVIEAQVRAHRQRWPILCTSEHPVAQVFQTGRALVMNQPPPDVAATLIPQGQPGGPVLSSLLVVPLQSRGQVIGALGLYALEAPMRYAPEDQVLMEDLAHRAAMALDNAQLFQEAQAAVKERDAFLSVASHELRNPLTSLLGRVQLIQRRLIHLPSTADRVREDAAIVLQQGQRINALLTELLDVSRLSSGQLTIVHEPLDLIPLIQRIIMDLQPTTTIHHLIVDSDQAAIRIEGDAARLEQVFWNLVSNAIKYSPDGGTIRVAVRLESAGVQIAVYDQGVGIHATDLPNVFTRFYRALHGTIHQIAGSGIGLYVAKEIVAAHAGTIKVDSREGGGSTFTVRLPLPGPPSEV